MLAATLPFVPTDAEPMMRPASTERTPRRLTDRHAGETVESLRAAVTLGPWLFLLLIVPESVIWIRHQISTGTYTLLLVVINPLLLVGIAWLLRRVSGRVATSLMGMLFSARGTPHTAEFSEIESLIIRGNYPEAGDALRSHLVAWPSDTAAIIRLADLTATHLRDPDAAVALLLRARETRPTPHQDIAIANGLIDLYRSLGREHDLGRELVRFARQHQGTSAGQHAWAAYRALKSGDQPASPRGTTSQSEGSV